MHSFSIPFNIHEDNISCENVSTEQTHGCLSNDIRLIRHIERLEILSSVRTQAIDIDERFQPLSAQSLKPFVQVGVQSKAITFLNEVSQPLFSHKGLHTRNHSEFLLASYL